MTEFISGSSGSAAMMHTHEAQECSGYDKTPLSHRSESSHEPQERSGYDSSELKVTLTI